MSEDLPTPLTDAKLLSPVIIWERDGNPEDEAMMETDKEGCYVPAQLARALERELAQWKACATELHRSLSHFEAWMFSARTLEALDQFKTLSK